MIEGLIIPLGMALGISIIVMAIFGIRTVKANKKAKKYKEYLEIRKGDVVSLSKINRDLEQHSQDLRNALNTNSKVLDERAAAVLDMKFNVIGLERELEAEKKKYANLIHQKKSSEVRVGLIGEQIAPFLREWPYDPHKFRFIGAPIDGIQITDKEVILLEIKTGRATLSKQQRKIRDMVKAGNVYFETFRIFEDGCQIKREKNNR